MSKIFVGPRHGFGAGRRGDINTLNKLSGELGFDFEVVPPVIRKGDFVSSNRIRKCLARGDVSDAWRFLGKPFYLRGRVIEGDSRGRELGFPTANLDPAENTKLSLKSGIYATITEVRGGRFQSVSHIGARPTIEGAVPSIESHIIGFDADIYGEVISIGFIEFLREVEAFDSIKELTAQIKRDRDLAIQRLLERGFGRYSAFSDRCIRS